MLDRCKELPKVRGTPWLVGLYNEQREHFIASHAGSGTGGVGGRGGVEDGPMQTRSALKEIFLEREQQRQDENSPSCFLLETCCGKSHPSQICQEGSFEITDKDTGSEVPRITSYVNQRSIGNGRGPPSDVSDLEPVHTLRSPSFPHSLWSEGGILPCGWQSTQVTCFF